MSINSIDDLVSIANLMESGMAGDEVTSLKFERDVACAADYVIAESNIESYIEGAQAIGTGSEIAMGSAAFGPVVGPLVAVVGAGVIVYGIHKVTVASAEDIGDLANVAAGTSIQDHEQLKSSEPVLNKQIDLGTEQNKLAGKVGSEAIKRKAGNTLLRNNQKLRLEKTDIVAIGAEGARFWCQKASNAHAELTKQKMSGSRNRTSITKAREHADQKAQDKRQDKKMASSSPEPTGGGGGTRATAH